MTKLRFAVYESWSVPAGQIGGKATEPTTTSLLEQFNEDTQEWEQVPSVVAQERSAWPPD